LFSDNAEPTSDPCRCEHTEVILEKLLGLSKDEIEKLAAQGAVELASPVAASGNS